MAKNGKIEIGKTPADKCGTPCEKIEENEPLVEGDEPNNRFTKWASMLGDEFDTEDSENIEDTEDVKEEKVAETES